MNILGIEKLASKGCKEALHQDVVSFVNQSFKNLKKATDIVVPKPLHCTWVEEYCDAIYLPCHYVTDNTLSIAPTYSELLLYEKDR